MKTFFLKHYRFISNLVVSVFPIIAYAQLIPPGGTFGDAAFTTGELIYNTILPAFLSLAVLVFIWGLSKFFIRSGNKTEIENGRKYMLWGTIALFVLLSVRAIIGVVINAVGLNGSTDADPAFVFIRF
ncbi:MAG: hypothetical protein WAX44_00855 [Minisyncoccia bacterium]